MYEGVYGEGELKFSIHHYSSSALDACELSVTLPAATPPFKAPLTGYEAEWAPTAHERQNLLAPAASRTPLLSLHGTVQISPGMQPAGHIRPASSFYAALKMILYYVVRSSSKVS